jgi:predicted O-linked N-acetylglucosamine transferase (SPINDLY family)
MPETPPADTDSLGAILEAALTAHRAQRLPEAEALYRRAIAQGDACPPAALINLGAILAAADRLDEAIVLYRAAAARDGGNFGAHFNLGNALHRRGDHAGALEAYGAAAKAKPDSAEARLRAGLMAFALARHEVALDHFLGAAAIAPEHADIWFNAAIALEALRRPEEAEAHYRKSMAVDPGFVEAGNNLAALLIARRRSGDAAAILRDIAARKPDYLRAHLNLAKLAIGDSPADAEISARRALAIDPANTEAMFVLANALTLLGRYDEAMVLLAQVRGTGSIELRYSSLIMGLPAIYDSQEQIEIVRAAYRGELGILARDLEGSETARRMLAETAIGNMHPFYLAYQQKNDREPQAALGALIASVMATRYPEFTTPLPLRPMPRSRRIRVGVASGYFRLHTILKLFGGWFRNFDRARFELFAYATNRDRDERTPGILQDFDHAVDGAALDFESLCRRIRDDELNVLIYPEIGMIPLSVRLAALRLAPVQCVAWGHPETTGLPTIDYFLTSALMEPPDAATHYTEKLIPLPGIGVCYQPLDLPKSGFDPARHGAEPGDILYLCAQSLYKYLPRDDAIYPRIAQQVPRAKFLFIGAVGIDPFRRRLERAFAAAGLDAARHVIVLPPLSQAEYLGLNAACDIYLDSIGWSGGNTSFEAILAGLPIVTRPGELMRGRHSTALLFAMGISETVAASEESYVAIAARLGNDPVWRAECAAQIRERRAAILDDRSSVIALEDFIAMMCVAI